MVVVPSGSFPTSTYHLTLVLFFIFVVELKYTNNENYYQGFIVGRNSRQIERIEKYQEKMLCYFERTGLITF
jgi:hypothetical protein